MSSFWDSLCGCIKLRADEVQAPSGEIAEVQATSGTLAADEVTSSISNDIRPSAPDTARSSGIVGWFASVRSYFTDLSCGFRRSKESGSIPDTRRRLPVNQALVAILGENIEPQQQLDGAVLTGRYDLARHIKLALAGGGDRKLAFDGITDSFRRMRVSGASLQEVQAVGEFKIDDDEALAFLDGLARSGSAGDASDLNLSKVVLTGTVDITDPQTYEQTLSRLQRASRLGVRMDKIKLTGSISTVKRAQTLLQALSAATGGKAARPNLNGVTLQLDVMAAGVGPEMLQDVKNLVSTGAKVASLNFYGTMMIGAEARQQHKQNLRSILDLAANRGASLEQMSVKATLDALDNDAEMLTLLKSARKLGAGVVIEGAPPSIHKNGLEYLLKLGRAGADLSSVKIARMRASSEERPGMTKMATELRDKYRVITVPPTTGKPAVAPERAVVKD